MSHTDPIIDKIIVARVGLLLRHPFFGNLATRLQIKEAEEWCGTAATDGRAIYFNRKFFEPLSIKQIEFVIAHEILHNVFDHMSRREGRDPQIFNIAADYCVNGQLVRDHIGEHVIEGIKIFHDAKYYGMGAEEIYDKIFDEMDEKQLQALGQLLDDHIDWGDQDPDSNRPSYSKDELKKIRDEMREATIQAAQAAGAGNTPASVQRMIKELTEPKMNWREIIRQQIQSIVRNDFSFARPSRKGQMSGAILPGMIPDTTIDVAIAVDMSGSIGEEDASAFLSEIKGIMDQYEDFKINLWCFDTSIYNHKEISQDNAHDLIEYEPQGGGGTDFDVNYEFMKEQGIQPKKFIMFTDGYPYGSWGDEEYCDTLFIVKGNTSAESPFGQTVIYEKEAA